MKISQKLYFAIIISMILGVMPQNSEAQSSKSKVDPFLSSLRRVTIESQIMQQNRQLPNSPFRISSYVPSVAKLFAIDLKKDDPVVRVIMQFNGSIEELQASGIDVQSKIGHLITAHFPISKLEELSRRTDVGYIELGKPVELDLDVSADKVRAPQARNDFGENGQNIIVGIIDIGIDITHEDFKNADGTTRILYIWDQRSSDGSPPILNRC